MQHLVVFSFKMVAATYNGEPSQWHEFHQNASFAVLYYLVVMAQNISADLTCFQCLMQKMTG
jgi:SRSO17 transposase